MAANGDEANTKILSDLEKDIADLISDETKSTKDLVRGMLRIMKTQSPFLLQSLADHTRVMNMWNAYRLMVWLMSGIGGLILILLWGIFTGKIELVHK
jgi:hypothetical protein